MRSVVSANRRRLQDAGVVKTPAPACEMVIEQFFFIVINPPEDTAYLASMTVCAALSFCQRRSCEPV